MKRVYVRERERERTRLFLCILREDKIAEDEAVRSRNIRKSWTARLLLCFFVR